MMLLLDLGNSRVKWALADQALGPWLAHGAKGWDENLVEQLQLAWTTYPPELTVVAASVVDGQREALVASVLANRFGQAPHWMRTPAQACGVRNGYAEPQRLGVDRFLTMVAARAAGHAPCVIAGAGTALTLDALAADGQHLGGLIAPGAPLMQSALAAATVHARAAQAGHILDAACGTADAVTSGCWHAVAALTERFVQRMAPLLGGKPTVVLGGGDAEQLLPLLTLPAQIMVDGVLRGLAHWSSVKPVAASSNASDIAHRRAPDQ